MNVMEEIRLKSAQIAQEHLAKNGIIIELDQNIPNTESHSAKLTIRYGDKSTRRFADIRKEIRKHHIAELKEKKTKYRGEYFLLAHRLYPSVKSSLIEAGSIGPTVPGISILKIPNFLSGSIITKQRQ